MKARIPNGGGNSRQDMLKNLQKMQEDMARVQEEVENSEFSSSAGGGAVTVTVNGRHEILSVQLQPEIVDPEDIEMLQDLLLAAANESLRKAGEAMEKAMEPMQNAMNIPGMQGLF